MRVFFLERWQSQIGVAGKPRGAFEIGVIRYANENLTVPVPEFLEKKTGERYW